MTGPYRIGQGYDIHRLVPGKPLKVGGVLIESPVGSEAHSDGDVLLHALIDALLGACALGDIGDHFPPSDAQYKNADSVALLQKIMPLIQEKGYAIGNLDATIFLEKPKLGPYKQQIAEKLSSCLEIAVGDISIKAKTAEKFPPLGTQEAIAASVTTLLTNRASLI